MGLFGIFTSDDGVFLWKVEVGFDVVLFRLILDFDVEDEKELVNVASTGGLSWTK